MKNIEVDGVLVDIYVPGLDMVILLPKRGIEHEERILALEETKKYSVLVWWEPEEWADERTGRALQQFRVTTRGERTLPVSE